MNKYQELEDLKNKLENYPPEFSSSGLLLLEDSFIKLEDDLRLQKHYRECGLGDLYFNASIDDLSDDNIKKNVGGYECILYEKIGNVDTKSCSVNLFEFISKYIKELEKNKQSLVICGPVASGKTYIAVSLVINYFLNYRIFKIKGNGKSVKCVPTFYFTSMQDIIALLSSKSFNSQNIIEDIRNRDIVIIDDMACETQNIFAKEIEQFIHIFIKHRENSNLPTIITTNSPPEKFVALYGVRANSILSGKRFTYLAIKTQQSWRK